jgi:hypothetical protein
MFRNLTCLGVKHIKKKVTTKCLEKCLDSKHIFNNVMSSCEGGITLIDYLLFHIPLNFFHLHGDVTNAGEGLQNYGLCSELRTFEHGGIFIVPHLL